MTLDKPGNSCVLWDGCEVWLCVTEEEHNLRFSLLFRACPSGSQEGKGVTGKILSTEAVSTQTGKDMRSECIGGVRGQRPRVQHWLGESMAFRNAVILSRNAVILSYTESSRSTWNTRAYVYGETFTLQYNLGSNVAMTVERKPRRQT